MGFILGRLLMMMMVITVLLAYEAYGPYEVFYS